MNKKPYQIPLDWDEAKEIADIITNTENIADDYAITEDALVEKYNISLDDFHEIARKIFELIDFGISPITSVPYVGIGKDSIWLAKKPINEQFINAVIQWCSEGEDFENVKGYKRIITLNNEPEYEIIIKKIKK